MRGKKKKAARVRGKSPRGLSRKRHPFHAARPKSGVHVHVHVDNFQGKGSHASDATRSESHNDADVSLARMKKAGHWWI